MHRGATFVAGVATFALVTCPLLRCSLQQASYDAPEEEDKETLQANSEDGEEGMVVRMVHVRILTCVLCLSCQMRCSMACTYVECKLCQSNKGDVKGTLGPTDLGVNVLILNWSGQEILYVI